MKARDLLDPEDGIDSEIRDDSIRFHAERRMGWGDRVAFVREGAQCQEKCAGGQLHIQD